MVDDLFGLLSGSFLNRLGLFDLSAALAAVVVLGIYLSTAVLAEQNTLYLTDVLLESFDGSLLFGNLVKKLLHGITAGIVKIVVIIGLADLQIKLVNCSLLGRDLEVSLYNICTKLSLFAYSLACIVDSFCKFFKHDFFLLLIWLCFRKPQTVLNAFCIASLCWLSCYVLSITHKSSYVNRLQRFLIFVNHFLIFF